MPEGYPGPVIEVTSLLRAIGFIHWAFKLDIGVKFRSAIANQISKFNSNNFCSSTSTSLGKHTNNIECLSSNLIVTSVK